MTLIRRMCVVTIVLALAACAEPKAPPAPAAPTTDATDWTPRVIKVHERVYCAFGYALANSIMVVVDGGKVIVDTTESAEAARTIRAEFDRIAPGPVLAVIYTHTHPDHILGASVFRDAGQDIWAGSKGPEMLSEQFASLSTTLRRRGSRQFGEGLAPGRVAGNAIGPRLRADDGAVPPLLYPTKTFAGTHRMDIGGVTFELVEAPGETHDQIFVWLPDLRVLLPGDNIYRAFPNLYALRGVQPRPVREWIGSLDLMRERKPEALVPSHTEPITGALRVMETLTAYRDAIAWVHDSVIRMANEGNSPDEMAAEIRLPEHLRDHPYLQETYGTVEWSVRGVYVRYFGWFDDNPANIHPLHPAETSRRTIDLMGGRDAVTKAARAALEAGEAQWAAQLATHLMNADPADTSARAIAADAFEELGARETNMNARGYYLVSAAQLRGDWKGPGKPQIDARTLADVPIDVLLSTFPERLDPATTGELVKSIAFRFSDSGKSFTLMIRNGVGELRAGVDGPTGLAFDATEADFKAFLSGELGPAQALASGRLRFTGSLTELIAFSSYLIKP
ncbi:MAG: MBL fold metallo-hydrolase [Deltaproteobacteria bacterium]|nr:MBL fold metallo-hydrolase [Deltaproteobacteria bacterium]